METESARAVLCFDIIRIQNKASKTFLTQKGQKMIWSGRHSLNQLFEIQPLGLHSSGQMVQFQQIFRLKHLISNQYLCIDDQDQIILDSHSNRAYAYFAAHRRSTVAKQDQHLAYNTPLYILTSNNTVFKYNQVSDQIVQEQPAVVGDRSAK